MSILDYLSWHYLYAPKRLPYVWKNYLTFIPYFFSLEELLRHLFAPWKRLTLQKRAGFDLQDIVNVISFNLVSRIIGALARIAIIITGIIIFLILVVLGPLGWLFWFLIPGFSYLLYSSLKKKNPVPKNILTPKTLSPAEIMSEFSKNNQGKFFLTRLGLTDSFGQLISQPSPPLEIPPTQKTSWTTLIIFLAEKWGPFSQLLKQNSLSREDAQRVLLWFEDWEKERLQNVRFWSLDNLLRTKPLGQDLIYGYTINLDKYSTDLTLPVPYSHHLVGRQKEAKSIEQVLARAGDNNVLLIGEPGVGRTTILLNFARLVAEGRVSPSLNRKRVLELNLNSVLAQTKTPQEAKGLVETIFNEAAWAGNIILVIKHIDLFLSSGDGRINLTDVFIKPAASSSLQVIGVTTPDDFQKYLYPNQEISKYFEKITVSPPTIEESFIILERVAPVFEQRTKTFITYPAIKEAIEKSDRYLIDLPFPEKAIDLLDEVCINVSEKGRILVTPQDVDELLSEKTKIPVGELKKDEKEKLVNLETVLHQRVIAQEEAVTQVAKAMRRARTGIASKNRPVGSFLFLGPTGVGKTETAKALAFAYFGSEERMIRFDMGEYQTIDALDRAIGCLATKEPGLFAKAIRENPFSLFLIDEVEKANSKLLNLFLTILDEGYFSDAFGRRVDCRSLIIIATSNAGAEFIRTRVGQGNYDENFSKEVVEEVLKKQIFSPEFINRFDGVIVFRPLTAADLEKIAELMLKNLNKRLQPKECSFKITPELITRVAELGYEPAFGARPMRRVIQDKIEDQIAQRLLRGEVKRGEEIEIKI
jgi:ATP-dependent Clp protease ATP-binding subunit ClpC